MPESGWAGAAQGSTAWTSYDLLRGMSIPRWNPSHTISEQEEFLLSRLRRTRKLFAFLRLQRHELFDEKFQDELAAMYRATGAGKPPCPPALLAMATLLQGYLRVSDAEAV